MKKTKSMKAMTLRAAGFAAGLGVWCATMFAASSGAMAAEPAHLHADDVHAGHAAELSLDHGRKWQTDAPLRRGMDHMRAAMAEAMPAIHAGKLDRAGHAALATRLENEVAYVVAHCELDPAADAQLHIVLARIGAGIERMKAAQGERGAAAVVQALDAYGQYFDHPGWQPLPPL